MKAPRIDQSTIFDAVTADVPMLPLADDEIIVDCFAGGGGASLGITWATGRHPDEAINHSASAIAIHEANHPTTRHHHSDIWEVDPLDVARGRRVGLLWLSPDCTHFSRAKGGKPVSKKIRILAHVAIRYAAKVRPRVIALENVEEFVTWGPVARATGKPDPRRKGKSFRAFVRQLRRLGYAVDWRLLRGCDYGSPTIRRRLFLVARCDGLPVRWPTPTHGAEMPETWAAGIIDWSIPCPSIFLTKAEAKALGLNVKRPLEEATLRRVGRGVWRYVIAAAEPFIVGLGGRQAQSPERPVSKPYQTITAKADSALVVPTLIQMGYGEREGQAPRVPGLEKPLGTVVAGGPKHALVAAFLAKHFGGVVGDRLTNPLPTVTATDHNALVTSHLVKLKGTARDGQPVTVPLHTVQAGGNHFAEVRAFLTAYYGNEKDGQSLREPVRTVTATDRLALVTVHGQDYVIADIGMRMLVPRELARGQGFPDSYVLDVMVPKPIARGNRRGETRLVRISKREQVEMVGNSVNPHVACALVRANLGAPVAQERAA